MGGYGASTSSSGPAGSICAPVSCYRPGPVSPGQRRVVIGGDPTSPPDGQRMHTSGGPASTLRIALSAPRSGVFIAHRGPKDQTAVLGANPGGRGPSAPIHLVGGWHPEVQCPSGPPQLSTLFWALWWPCPASPARVVRTMRVRFDVGPTWCLRLRALPLPFGGRIF